MGDYVECTSNPSQVWDKEAGVCSHQTPNHYLIKMLPRIINLSQFQLALGHIQHVPRARRKTPEVVSPGCDCGRKQPSGCVGVRPGFEEPESKYISHIRIFLTLFMILYPLFV